MAELLKPIQTRALALLLFIFLLIKWRLKPRLAMYINFHAINGVVNQLFCNFDSMVEICYIRTTLLLIKIVIFYH